MKAILYFTLFILMTFTVFAIPDWDMTGTYVIEYTCISGCTGDYPHTMQVTLVNLNNGDFSGSGYYNPNTAYTWDVTGNVDQSDITFQVVYTGLNPGYTLNAVGSIAGDGTLSGTATAPGQTFTWESTDGAATPYTNEIPEFTTIGAGLVLIGAGLYMYRKRRRSKF